MYLAPASLDPQLVKGKFFQYCKSLVESIDNNHALAKQLFHYVLQGNEKQN